MPEMKHEPRRGAGILGEIQSAFMHQQARDPHQPPAQYHQPVNHHPVEHRPMEHHPAVPAAHHPGAGPSWQAGVTLGGVDFRIGFSDAQHHAAPMPHNAQHMPPQVPQYPPQPQADHDLNPQRLIMAARPGLVPYVNHQNEYVPAFTIQDQEASHLQMIAARQGFEVLGVRPRDYNQLQFNLFLRDGQSGAIYAQPFALALDPRQPYDSRYYDGRVAAEMKRAIPEIVERAVQALRPQSVGGPGDYRY